MKSLGNKTTKILTALIGVIAIYKISLSIQNGCPPKNRDVDGGTFTRLAQFAISNDYWGSGALRLLNGRLYCLNIENKGN